MNSTVLRIHPGDNVAVALADLPQGCTIAFDGREYVMANPIPAKHKFFLQDMREGDEVTMYGVLVGRTLSQVPVGGLMTTANVSHAAQPYAYRAAGYAWTPPDVSKWRHRTFMGYPRSDGRVGTANYWLFIPTVFCENRK